MAVITFTGSRSFAWNHQAVANCTKETDRTGKVILRCPFLIRLLRPLPEIRQWKKEQKKNGNVRLAFSSQGMRDVRTRITKIESFVKGDGTNSNGEQVTGTFMQYAKEVRTYHFRNLATNHFFTIEATPTHPFYTESRHGYVSVRRLSIHDKLENRHGQQIQLLCPPGKTARCGIPLHENTPIPVYNLEVKSRHHYLVSSEGILVHNWCPLEEYLKKVIPDHVQYYGEKAYINIQTNDNLLLTWLFMIQAGENNIANDDIFCVLFASMKTNTPVEIEKLHTLYMAGLDNMYHLLYPEPDFYRTAARNIYSTFGEIIKTEESSLPLATIMDAPGKKVIFLSRNSYGMVFERYNNIGNQPVFASFQGYYDKENGTIEIREIKHFKRRGTPITLKALQMDESLSYINL